MESFPEMANKVTALVRATGIEDPGRMNDAGTERPDPEVPERVRRRTFTAKYKLEILAAYDAAPAGEKGALLRREGLYSSHIVQWRQARDAGALAGLAVPRGRKRRDPQAERIARLEAEKQQLEQELAKTRFVVDVQAKLHALLETLSESAEPENGSTKGATQRSLSWSPRSAYATPAMSSVSPKPAITADTGTARHRSGRRQSRTPTDRSLARCPRLSGPRSWLSCTASGSSTPRRPRCGPHCSTKAATSAQSRPSTGCCAKPGAPA